MRLGLLLAILAFPLLELALLIRVGQAIGVWATLGIVVGTAILGLIIIRWQGFTVVQRVMRAVGEGRSPALNLVDSSAVFMAGALLITPGLIADTIGLLLLIPWVRLALGHWARRHMVSWGSTQIRVFRTGGGPRSGEPRPPEGKGPVIEVDYKRVDKNSDDR